MRGKIAASRTGISLFPTLVFHHRAVVPADILRSTSTQVQANTVSILERQVEQTSLLSDLRHIAGLKGHVSDNASSVNKVLWLVSIGRNPDFVGRTSVMSTLESKLAAKPDAVPTAVLCGLGGVG